MLSVINKIDMVETYKNLIDDLKAKLKQHGFIKKGNVFYLTPNENFGVIEFQKSRDSTKDNIKFTINVGTCSNVLMKIKEEDKFKGFQFDQCHWKTRIGRLLPVNTDYWWNINNQTNAAELTEEVYRIIIDIAVPEMMNHITDEMLIETWKKQVAGGLTEYQRMINVVSLLKARKSEELSVVANAIREEVKGTRLASSIEEDFKELGI
jgi:hypothetical protein